MTIVNSTNASDAASQDVIEIMEQMDGLCLHPSHYHSFQVRNGMELLATVRNLYPFSNSAAPDCVLCATSLASSSARWLPRMFSSSNEEATLKCLACGALAHRSCAMTSSSFKKKKWAAHSYCSVNAAKMQSRRLRESEELASTRPVARTNRMETSDNTGEWSDPPCLPLATQPSVVPPRKKSVASYPGNHMTVVQPPNTTRNSDSQPSDDVPIAPPTTDTPNHPPPGATSTTNHHPTLSVPAVAGGIAGGICGLALIGPAGAAYACYVTAGGMNVLLGLEGAATLSVIAAGIATGGMTGQHIQSHLQDRTRVLTMASSSSEQPVLLVRSNIVLDPVWEDILVEAKRSAPPRTKSSLATTRDADICATTEDELNTSDKVLLLVSRILNDKSSLPGHVYRYLVETFLDRGRRTPPPHPRARRDDAHAVIHHVTATVLEERRELAGGIRERTASAVESIVFGPLYDAVLEEIVQETMEQNVGLFRKMTLLWNDHPEVSRPEQCSLVSVPALNALKMIPQSRSVGDKLHFCVEFMEAMAQHYASRTDRSICADTLIRMVCQHVLWSENCDNLFAQVMFVEEFARDEQLVRGRDGYALVTIQAALHVLNDCTDLYLDLFSSEVEEATREAAVEDVALVADAPGADLADLDCNNNNRI